MAKTPAKLEEAPKEAPIIKPKKKKLKLIIIILALLLLITAVIIGVIWYTNLRVPDAVSSLLNIGGSEKIEETSATTSTGNSSNIPSQITGQTTMLVSLPQFVVNLADSSANKYLKLSVDVEVASEQASKEISNQSSKIRDAIILLLSSKTQAELSSPEGKIQIKNDIANRINQVLGSPRVLRVFFTEFVIS